MADCNCIVSNSIVFCAAFSSAERAVLASDPCSDAGSRLVSYGGICTDSGLLTVCGEADRLLLAEWQVSLTVGSQAGGVGGFFRLCLTSLSVRRGSSTNGLTWQSTRGVACELCSDFI